MDVSSYLRKCAVRLPLAAVFVLCLSSCTQDPDPNSRISIQFPSQSATRYSSVTASSTTWGVADPTDINQIVCFGVGIGGPEPILQSRECHDSHGATVFRAGLLLGAFPAGAVAS